MNPCRYSVLLAIAFICTGCMTSAALVTYPGSLKLHPEPPRYYEMSLDVRVTGKSYHIDYSWNCEQKKHFTASVMKWVLSWQSERKIVAKQIDDGKTFFFMQPGYCGTDSVNLVPQLVVTNGELQPTSATYFDIRYDAKESRAVSDAVTQGIARRVQAPSRLGEMTPKEEELASSMRMRLHGFVSRKVSVAAEEAWQTNGELVKIFSNLTDTTRAIDLLPRRSRLTYFTFKALKKSSKGWKRPEPLRHYDPVFHKGKLVLDVQPFEAKGRVFHFESEGGCKNSIDFCNLGQCIPVKGAVNEIYYPASRELVSISCRTLRHAFTNS